MITAAPGAIDLNRRIDDENVELAYDPERDFVPIGLIASNPNTFTVNASIQAGTIAQLIALAKASPGKLNYASGGLGTSPQLSMELFRMQAGIDIVHIPYKGVGPAFIALMAGRVQAMTSTVPAALSSVRNGKIRALAVTRRSATRSCRTCRPSPKQECLISRLFRGRVCARTLARRSAPFDGFAARSQPCSLRPLRENKSATRAFSCTPGRPTRLRRSSRLSARDGRRW